MTTIDLYFKLSGEVLKTIFNVRDVKEIALEILELSEDSNISIDNIGWKYHFKR